MQLAAPTMTSIAKEAGVSVAVVSRLLRGDPSLRISDERRRVILAISDRCGPPKIRRTLRRRTRTIMVPVNRIFSADWIRPNLANSEAFRSFESALQAQSFRLNLSLFDHERRHESIEEAIRSGNACDGICLLSGIADAKLAELLHAHRFPHVCWSYDAGEFGINTVLTHFSAGLKQAVNHLYELGHRQIGFFGHRTHYRYPLMVAAAVGVGLPVNEHYSCWIDMPEPAETPQAWEQRASQTLSQWLDANPWPTALVCSNDRLALAALKVLEQRGYKPGEGISLVGCDNMEQRGATPSPDPVLTTIDAPNDQIGRRAAELLLNQILHGQTQIVHERLPTRLIVRRTTGPARHS